MKYFSNISSFADLKKQYRKLALEHHPDKGGDVLAMQEINKEFDKLFDYWKDIKTTSNTKTGYEYDYSYAKTSTEYTEYVYNEYRWRGSRCGSIPYSELSKHFKQWTKSTYPNCKFSVTCDWAGYTRHISVNLYQADFECFIDASMTNIDINHYWLENENRITDRCREVISNVIDYVKSFNYDNSDSMTDYFDVGFYMDFKIGSYSRNFKYVPKMLDCECEVEKEIVTPTEREIKKVMRGVKWGYEQKYNPRSNKYEDLTEQGKVLLKDNDGNSLYAYYGYNTDRLQTQRLKSLQDAGIMCHRERDRIFFDGYTKELEEQIKRERDAMISAKNKVTPKQENKSFQVHKNIQMVDYSEKAVAIIGDTKAIKDKLKELGGRFNPRLSCGAGWIFSKKKEQEIRNSLMSL